MADLRYGWIFRWRATAPLQARYGVWASTGISGVVSGSTLAAHLRLTRRTPLADPRTKYGSYFVADIKPA